MKRINRAQLRGEPLDEDCKKANIVKHEYGPKDNRIFCYGVCDGYDDFEVAEKCCKCKAYAYNAEPWEGE